MPRCFAVVRTLERKKRSSTEARIATDGSYIRKHVSPLRHEVRYRSQTLVPGCLSALVILVGPRQAFLVVESNAVSQRPGHERDQEATNRHDAPDVEQQPLVSE